MKIFKRFLENLLWETLLVNNGCNDTWKTLLRSGILHLEGPLKLIIPTIKKIKLGSQERKKRNMLLINVNADPDILEFKQGTEWNILI